MKNDHEAEQAEHQRGVGWCYEILPPHYSRDETRHYGPNPPHMPPPPNWEAHPHPASCQCGYCIDRQMGRCR